MFVLSSSPVTQQHLSATNETTYSTSASGNDVVGSCELLSSDFLEINSKSEDDLRDMGSRAMRTESCSSQVDSRPNSTTTTTGVDVDDTHRSPDGDTGGVTSPETNNRSSAALKFGIERILVSRTNEICIATTASSGEFRPCHH